MSRWRAALAVALVGFGAITALTGPSGVIRTLRFGWAHAGILLIAVAVLALLATVAPRGALAGPIIVAAAGIALLGSGGAWSREITWAVAGAGMVLIGAWLVVSVADLPRDEIDPVWRKRTVLFPGVVNARPGERAPHELTATVVGTRLVIDLRAAAANRYERTELVVSCWAGRVDVRVPGSWAVLAGRLHTAHGIRFTGRLDRDRLVPYPAQAAQFLGDVASRRAKRYQDGDEPPPSMAVVVHVLGAAGEVNLVGRD